MDTGARWYITSSAIKVDDNALSTSQVLAKQSGRVIKVTEGVREYYLFASRVANVNFSGRIAASGTDTAQSAQRAFGGGLGGMNLTVTNLKDKANQLTATTDVDGKFEVEGAIPGDGYAVTVEEQTTNVTPIANGDDIGTITVTGGVNFKTSIKPESTSVDMQRLYANLSAYKFVITLQNTGTADCMAATYTFDFDSDLVVISKPASQILGTIEPGKSKTIEVTVSCQPIQAEYEFKKIGISITDRIENKTWEDSVSLKFNKAPVNFNIKANGKISGVIITPNANAYSFSGKSSSLTMPWSTSDYLVVFSGADADTEAIYSLGVNVAADSDFTGFIDLGNYEGNNTEDTATAIKVSDKIMSYLHKNDIDYYKINMGTAAPEIKPVSMIDFAYTDATGNGDRTIQPSESGYLDILVKNNTNAMQSVSAVLTTTSSYVTIDKGTATIGDLSAGYYTTLTGTTTSGYSSASSASLLYSNISTKAFKFTVSSICPVGENILFTVTFTDSWGNTWTDTLTVPVVGTGASIGINTPVTGNYQISEAANDNADGKANPHETHYLDIRIKNGGTSKVLGLQAALTTANSYVTIDKGTATIGDLSAGYYTTLTYGQYSNTASSSASYTSLLHSDYLAKAFKFTISDTCPAGTNIPFTVTFTDSWGNTWTDTLTIPVVATGASIGINTPVTDNYKISEAANGNADGKANPHESHYLDIRVKNKGTSRVLGLQAVLSTTSSYVAIDKGTAATGDLSAGYYTTLTYGQYSNTASSSASYTSLLHSDYLAKTFKFTISGTCPVGTDIPFTVTFTDSWGNTWTDTLTVPVVATGANIGINTPVTDNYKIKETTSGNGKANPNESHYLDIRIKNGGTSKALGLQAALSTSNSYVTIDKGTVAIGDLSAGYYTTLTYGQYSNTASSSASYTSLLHSDYLAKAFKFTISSTCPVGTQLPFTITFTDSWGNTWTDILTIPVQ